MDLTIINKADMSNQKADSLVSWGGRPRGGVGTVRTVRWPLLGRVSNNVLQQLSLRLTFLLQLEKTSNTFKHPIHPDIQTSPQYLKNFKDQLMPFTVTCLEQTENYSSRQNFKFSQVKNFIHFPLPHTNLILSGP